MNNTTNPPTSPQVPASKHARLWRVGRRCLIGLVTLVTLFALFHVEENWRGKRAWTQYKAKMEPQGAVFTLEKLIPPSVPDDQNFTMTPLLKPILDMNPPGTRDAEGNLARWRDPEGKKRVEAIRVELPAPTGDEPALPDRPEKWAWRLGERFNLSDWQAYYAGSQSIPAWPESRGPAQDVLKALSRFDAELDELREASQRPHSRYNIYYGEKNPMAILLPHLSVLRNISKVVQLKAIAELDAGNPERAFEDVQLILHLSGSLAEEPFLISHLVRIAVLEIAQRVMWEGMNDHQWSPAQIRAFDAALRQIDLIGEMRPTFEAERTFGCEIVGLMAGEPSMVRELEQSIGNDSPFRSAALRLVPRGWIYLEGVNYNRVFDDHYLKVLPTRAEDLDVAEVKVALGELESQLESITLVNAFLKHRFLMRMLLPALSTVVVRSTEAQAMKDMAVIALALEGDYLENKAYPGNLLSPSTNRLTQLPADPVTHKPFHYERLDPESYRLWSVGWNLQDDGGEVRYEGRNGRRRLAGREQQLDWFWPSIKGMRLREQ